MKKIFSFLFLIFINTSYSQDKNLGGTLYTDVTPIKRINSEAKNDKIQEAKLEVNNQSLTTTPTGSSTETGVTEGSLTVSSNGTSNYNIAIAMPPGINGVIPQIALSYNSQSNNGLAGYGWNISGISSINRINANKYYDGVSDPVDFNNLDRFSLDGQRLLIKNGTSGNYGANGTIYETENFSNVKVTSYGVHPSGANYGPGYFLVEYPDGSKAEYGNSSDSRSIMSWSMTYWQNPQGIRFNYKYSLTNNSLYITSVEYGAINTNPSINKVEFIYKTRNRKEQYFIQGNSVYDDKILSNIKITGSGIGFRNYDLSHEITSLGYERLKTLTEKSGDGLKSLNPTVFTYNNTNNNLFHNTETFNLSVGNINSINSETISGDFDGDGKLDFVLFDKGPFVSKMRFWLFNRIEQQSTNIGYQVNLDRVFGDIFPSTWLTQNNKIAQMQGITITQTGDGAYGSINFKTFNLFAYGVYQQYEKRFDFPIYNTGETISSNGFCNYSPLKLIPKHIVNGDFNGDGLTDVLAIEKNTTFYKYGSCDCCDMLGAFYYVNGPAINYTGGKTYFVDLDRRLTSSTPVFSGNVSITNNSKLLVSDVDGDGKSDLLVFDGGVVKIYKVNDTNQIVLYKTYSDSDININKPLLLGDFNGDGKTDFFIHKSDNYGYFKYLFNGNSFVKESYNDGIGYTPPSGPLTHNIVANDLNNDGRTDIIVTSASNHDNGVLGVTLYQNNGVTFSHSAQSNTNYDPNIKAYAIPVFLPTAKGNKNLQVSFITGNKIHTFNSEKDFNKERLLTEVTLGNGSKEVITYNSLEYNNSAPYNYTPVYTDSQYTEDYPNFDIINAPSYQVVSKVEKYSSTNYKKQLFSYHGGVSNIEGLGFLGFRSTLRTNWHDDNTQIISTISKNSINLRGANVENFSVLGVSYPNYELYNGSNFIARTLNTFNTYDNIIFEPHLLSNKVLKLKNTITKSFNGLENTSTETIVNYDGYNYPLQSTTTTKNGNIIEQKIDRIMSYELPSSSPHLMGKVLTNKETVTVNPGLSNQDITDSEEQYSYDVNLLTQIKKKGESTDFVVEDNIYDNFGNIKRKTISTTGLASRITNYQYDSSGRFLIKSIDIQGLETEFNYNNSNGLLLSEKNPFSLSTTYTYDSWGKKIKTTDYLGKSQTIGYVRSNQNILITKKGDDGSESNELFDDLGRKIKTGIKDLNNNWSYVSYVYDIYDRNVKISEPYLSSPTLWNETKFDNLGRIEQTKSSAGKIITYTYSGLTTTSTDGLKSKIATKNSLGNIISLIDNPGGTINYQYFANGKLKKSDFEGNIINMDYDGWGNRIKLDDPSAGVYTYEYNAFGEMTKEVSPKGQTLYVLDDVGKIIEKQITSVDSSTNSKSTYTYDATTKLLISTSYDDFIEGSHTEYTNTYDASKRIIKTTEINNSTASFERQITYDAFGRPLKEFYGATNIADSKLSKIWVRNTYKNGQLWQILDDVSSKVLWQKDKVNERGQITDFTFGNGLLQTNAYDAYGFPFVFETYRNGISRIHRNTSNTNQNSTLRPIDIIVDPNDPVPTDPNDPIDPDRESIITLTYNFNPERGLLLSRTNSLFNTVESFKYDNLDRLIEWGGTPRELFNFNFENGVEDFINENIAGVSVSSGRLKIGTSNPNSGAKRLILENATIDTKIKISGIVDDGFTTSDPYSVRFSVIEENLSTGQLFTYPLGSASNGLLEVEHTITNSNSNVYLKIDKLEYPEYVVQLRKFYVDDIKITKLEGVEKQSYDDKGRITGNNLGNYNYTDVNKNYRNTSVFTNLESENYYIKRPLQNVTYNAFKSPVMITQDGYDKINFLYGDNYARTAMYYGGLDDDKMLRCKRKFYSAGGSMEIKHNACTGETNFITYIGGDGYSAPVVLNSDGTNKEYLYLHRDYQGSIIAVSNENATLIEKRLFDAWGEISKVLDENDVDLNGRLVVLDRGYTGHEHLLSVGLINMNGRLYDSKLHRFLQPDNFIQDPYNTQNFNRYGYVLNNPLMYIDTNGESFGSWWNNNWRTVVTVVAAVATAVIIVLSCGTATPLATAIWAGVGAGFVGGALGTALNGGSAFDIVYNGLWGAGTGAIAGAIGGYAAALAPAGAFAGALYGGTTNVAIGGLMNHMQGRPVMQGAVLGFALGAIGGGLSGYQSANSQGLNPWTGATIKPPVAVVSSLESAGPITAVSTEIETAAIPKRVNKPLQDQQTPPRQSQTIKLIKGTDGHVRLSEPIKANLPAEYYPPNNGAMQGTTKSLELPVGAKIDRFGSEFGKYFSPEGTPLELRALPPQNSGGYNLYEVVKPFTVESSSIAPAFNQVGTGTQYFSKFLNAEELVRGGYLIRK